MFPALSVPAVVFAFPALSVPAAVFAFPALFVPTVVFAFPALFFAAFLLALLRAAALLPAAGAGFSSLMMVAGAAGSLTDDPILAS